MTSFVSDRIKWTRDSDGAWLCIRVDHAPTLAEAFDGKRITLTIKEYRKKRSLDANAFYWATISQLAEVLQVSNPFLHNLMLRRYGQAEEYDGGLVYVLLPDDDESARKADEAETYHLKPTSNLRQGKDGKLYRAYILLRGSSTYDSKEMSRLIDGLVSECKETGVVPRYGQEWL